MKSYKEFCIDANIQEFWNPFAPQQKQVQSQPQAQSQPVLAYKNYKPGVLNKQTGEFTQRAHTGPEQKRYGWKPVEVSAYEPTGNLTASGEPFTQSTPPSVAVPWRSEQDKRPKIDFGTKVVFTNKPMGTATKKVTADVTDTGNFGRKDKSSVNPNTFADVSPTLRQELKPGSSSISFGKPMVYTQVSSPTSSAKINPSKK